MTKIVVVNDLPTGQLERVDALLHERRPIVFAGQSVRAFGHCSRGMQDIARNLVQPAVRQTLEEQTLALMAAHHAHRLAVGQAAILVRVAGQEFCVLITEDRQGDVEHAFVAGFVVAPTALPEHVERAQAQDGHRIDVDAAQTGIGFLNRDRQLGREFAQCFGNQRRLALGERRQGKQAADDGRIARNFERPDAAFIDIDEPGRIERHDVAGFRLRLKARPLPTVDVEPPAHRRRPCFRQAQR